MKPVKKRNLSKKFYESDANQSGSGNKQNNSLSDTMVEDKSEDEDELLIYNYEHKTLVGKLCSCFTSS